MHALVSHPANNATNRTVKRAMTAWIARPKCIWKMLGLISLPLFSCSNIYAQTPFTSLYVFGGSYADNGTSACLAAYGPANCPYPRHTLLPVPPGTPITSYIVPYSNALQLLYHVPASGLFNYAVGGSTTYNGTDGFTETAAVNAFLASGTRLNASDLVTIEPLANDQNVNPDGTPPARILASAQAESAADTALIQKLINAGARTLSFVDPGNLGLSAEGGPNNFSQYAAAATAASINDLVPLARSGVRIFYFQNEIFLQRLNTDPQLYGFATKNDAFLPTNGRHLNPTGMTILAEYVENQVDSPTTVTPQGEFVMSQADSFAEATFARLDANRNFSSYALGSNAPGMNGTGTNRWSAYAEANYAGASRDSQFYATDGSVNTWGGTAGLEYRISPEWKAGVTFSMSQPEITLTDQSAHIKDLASEVGLYSSYTAQNWFSDGLLAYGRQSLDMSRDGVISGESITGSTDANLFTAAIRGGYLLNAGRFRVGPIAGLNYASAHINGYAESGDALITQNVSGQQINDLTGDLGVQFRAPFSLGSNLISPFLNVTAEHEFLDSNRTLTTSLVTVPQLPILTPVDDNMGRTYGQVEIGLSGILFRNVVGTIDGYSTFARSGGNDYGINAGVQIAF